MMAASIQRMKRSPNLPSQHHFASQETQPLILAMTVISRHVSDLTVYIMPGLQLTSATVSYISIQMAIERHPQHPARSNIYGLEQGNLTLPYVAICQLPMEPSIRSDSTNICPLSCTPPN